eukprot:2509771-Amphidinium_carterae.1
MSVNRHDVLVEGPHAVDDAVAALKKKYTVTEFFGFNPIVKRTVVRVTVNGRPMQISKGLRALLVIRPTFTPSRSYEDG